MRRIQILLLTLAVAGSLLGFRPAPADDLPAFEGGPTDYVTVSDGTSIAVSVIGKDACSTVDPDGAGPARAPAFVNECPAILEMAGYENGSSNADGRTTTGQLEDWGREHGYDGPSPPLTGDSHEGTTAFRFDGSYVLVHASVRGTGCSGGEFDLFSYRSSLDGYEIIENWIVKQPWYHAEEDLDDDPGVGIIGHSYSGITGFLISALEGKAKREGKPSHLKAIAISGLVDDLYRGITYPGGIFNGLFPPAWSLGIRMAYDVVGGTLQGIFRNAYAGNTDIAIQCAANVATHRRTVLNDPLVQGITDTDNDWWRSRSLVEKAPLIAHPIHMSGAFQDEQTGPRFPHLWEVVPKGIPKRLQMGNGDHGTQVSNLFWQDRKAWMDCWIRSVSSACLPEDDEDQDTWVRTYLERSGSGVPSGIIDSEKFPLESTDWTQWYFGANGGLVEDTAQATGSGMYVSGTKRQSWSYQAGQNFGEPVTTATGPDELRFQTAPFTTTRVLDGPIVANLNVSSTANDFDVFVQVADLDVATGDLSILQRGMLRASHRALTSALSDWRGSVMYRPFHPHTNPVDVMPGDTTPLTVEVFPVAWIFRPGHALVVKIMAPPAVDSYYSYMPARTLPLALNTVTFGGLTGSRIMLPFVPTPSGLLASPGCGNVDQVRCVHE
jgi:uncharacterized protein